MLLIEQFKVDLIQMKHTADPDKLLESHKKTAAIEMGNKLAESFPFKKNDELSFKGHVPEVSMNREHEFTDLYESRIYIMSEEDYKQLYSSIRAAVAYNPNLSHLLTLLNK